MPDNPATLMPVEEYLRTAFRPDRDYLEGVLEERNMGEKEHSRIQMKLAAYFYNLGGLLRVWPEQRLQVNRERYRVPDLCVTIGEPAGQIFTDPPLVAIEILSSDDTLRQMLPRLLDYACFGVPHIWLIDPWNRKAYVFREQSLIAADLLEVGGPAPVAVSTEWLFGGLE